MLDKARKFVDQPLHYKLVQCKKTGEFDIMDNFIGHVTLLQLVGSLGNVSHTVIMVGTWCFIQIEKNPCR